MAGSTAGAGFPLNSREYLQPTCRRDLLKRCISVKTVRLCLQLGRDLSRPWAGKLDPSQLPTGSDRPWVFRSGEWLNTNTGQFSMSLTHRC